MFRPRIIPVLLLKNLGLVKSIKFKNHRYIGDPINAVKMFNDKKADELVFLDVNASKENRLISPNHAERFSAACKNPVTGSSLSFAAFSTLQLRPKYLITVSLSSWVLTG